MEKKRSVNIRGIRESFLFVVILLPWILAGCAKDGGVCVTTTGQLVRQARNVNYFTQIDIQDNVNLVLKTDTGNSVVVEAGQNIISGVSTTVSGGILNIRNNNKCNWLRDYSKPVNVYVTASGLWKISYNGSGDITTSGTLKQDSLNVEVWGGCGTINLTLDLWQGSFSLNMGTVDFRLHGVCAITSVYSGDYGLYDARDMKTGYTFITNKGSNDSYVMAVNDLDATIGSIGNIYYSGNPKNVKAAITGTGQVIPFTP
jgi:hypothetical protein